jgi:hypothetical protein
MGRRLGRWDRIGNARALDAQHLDDAHPGRRPLSALERRSLWGESDSGNQRPMDHEGSQRRSERRDA